MAAEGRIDVAREVGRTVRAVFLWEAWLTLVFFAAIFLLSLVDSVLPSESPDVLLLLGMAPVFGVLAVGAAFGGWLLSPLRLALPHWAPALLAVGAFWGLLAVFALPLVGAHGLPEDVRFTALVFGLCALSETAGIWLGRRLPGQRRHHVKEAPDG